MKKNLGRIHQIDEILSLYSNDPINEEKIVFLFKEILEDLVIEEQFGAFVDFKVSCIEIAELCTRMYHPRNSEKVSYVLSELIKLGMTLNSYPESSFISPSEILAETILSSNMNFTESKTYHTIQEKILHLTEVNTDISIVALKLGISETSVRRTIFLYGARTNP